jgi:hypothetical protein
MYRKLFRVLKLTTYFRVIEIDEIYPFLNNHKKMSSIPLTDSNMHIWYSMSTIVIHSIIFSRITQEPIHTVNYITQWMNKTVGNIKKIVFVFALITSPKSLVKSTSYQSIFNIITYEHGTVAQLSTLPILVKHEQMAHIYTSIFYHCKYVLLKNSWYLECHIIK